MTQIIPPVYLSSFGVLSADLFVSISFVFFTFIGSQNIQQYKRRLNRHDFSSRRRFSPFFSCP